MLTLLAMLTLLTLLIVDILKQSGTRLNSIEAISKTLVNHLILIMGLRDTSTSKKLFCLREVLTLPNKVYKKNFQYFKMPLSDKYILVRPGCPADTRFLFQPSKVISFLATIPHSHPHYFHTPNIKIFPHSQFQNNSKLPISKYFHTPNIKIFPNSQYQNISTILISNYFHISNIEIFSHYSAISFTLFPISKYPTLCIFIQILRDALL